MYILKKILNLLPTEGKKIVSLHKNITNTSFKITLANFVRERQIQNQKQLQNNHTGQNNLFFRHFFNSFTTAARSSGHNSVTTGARYSGQTILIICNVNKQIAQNTRTCLFYPDNLLPEVGHLSGYFFLKW